MNKLRAVEPSNNGDAARFRPVQPVNDRVIRKCCQNSGSRSFGVFQIVTKSFLYWKKKQSKEELKNTPLNIYETAKLKAWSTFRKFCW